jgi:hypothetical protein
MNFIEQVFNISPDGGNGATELAIFVALVLAMSLVLRLLRMRRARKPYC